MREVFVGQLVRDVLGPRGGLREALTENPLGEYITGVLAPFGVAEDAEPDAQLELPTEEYVEETEETVRTEDVEVTPLAPVLKPQCRPFSLGLSFVVVQGDGPPGALDICVTWARYSSTSNGHPVCWIREPRAVVLRDIPLVPDQWCLGPGGPVATGSPEVSVHLTTRPVALGQTLVTLHLVNRIAMDGGRGPDASLHVFQPQLRIRCRMGSAIVPGTDATPETDEEAVLRFLYRDRPVLARGHLCSAVWREIDPEIPPAEPPVLDVPAAAQAPPFGWVDGDLLSTADQGHFGSADVRSEYVPLVAIPSLDLTLPQGHTTELELRSDRLAELWDPHRLFAALFPLLRGYRQWIWDAWRASRVLRGPERRIARMLLSDCRGTSRRIKLGIELLTADDEVRLAFCFAMRAVALQSQWPLRTSPRHPLRWYPFQLAFILACIESIANSSSSDRDLCDLLWVPTGGGKTEAYLALMAFTIGLRRRRASHSDLQAENTGAGVAVLSRYTLRLLSIQQFRRTLKLVTACELLRVHALGERALPRPPIGWRPTDCTLVEDFLWGTPRFSIGLWVGQSLSPNRLQDSWANNRSIPGALTLLSSGGSSGEPAQVLRCPACDALLAVPQDGSEPVPQGGYTVNWTVRGRISNPCVLHGVDHEGLAVQHASFHPLPTGAHGTLRVVLGGRADVTADLVDQLWERVRAALPGIELACARGARPGYFLRSYVGSARPYDFDILCPSLECPLHMKWAEGTPAGCIQGVPARATGPSGGVMGLPRFSDGMRLVHVSAPFGDGSPFVADRVPIPAYTVDDQVYHRCPSVVIATVDKFARPAFEPRAGALFGNVLRHHCLYGFYRPHLHAGDTGRADPSPAGRRAGDTWVDVAPFAPPDLIVQDELHLLEGPLGSLVGLYETAIDVLSRGPGGQPIKYIASSATVRQAHEQVQAIFSRRVATFPPPGLSADNSFFIRFSRRHPLEGAQSGRLYVGICAPGRGPLTPLLRIWARLLQTAYTHAHHPEVDPFWTLTGYFNAIRELAGARALYRQDIPERLDFLARLDATGVGPRPLPDDLAQELSGRMESTQLPVVLDLLSLPLGQTALFTTSMFGTGVDIPRLGLMVVNGQPKTTSSYIQATGRVGRRVGALVVSFLRATRPRDLNHYEYFCGYHVQLHRYVEPVTVMPFAPGACDRAIGPVEVFLLRNRRGNSIIWSPETIAPPMMSRLRQSSEVTEVPPELETRAASQPLSRRPSAGAILGQAMSVLDDWQAVANRNFRTLRYVEYSDQPSAAVVLGDARHQHQGFEVVCENVPQSLRDIEETCGFQT